MATYYVTEISKGDKSIAGFSIKEVTYDNDKEALIHAEAAFHKKIGTAMDSSLYDSDLVYVTDENGTQLFSKKFTRSIA